MASTGGHFDEQMQRNQICVEDRLEMLSFLVSLIHVQEKKGNKLTKNWITDCQTTSVNRTNRPKIACAHVEKSSTFFKGIAAGNQNLTKLTF